MYFCCFWLSNAINLYIPIDVAILIVEGGSTSASVRWSEELEDEDGKVDGRLYIVEILLESLLKRWRDDWWEHSLDVKGEDTNDLWLDVDAEETLCGRLMWESRRRKVIWGMKWCCNFGDVMIRFFNLLIVFVVVFLIL